MQTTSEHTTESKAANTAAKTFIPPVVIQKKLEIGDADDKYEQEADRMADQVLQMKPIGADKAKPTNTGIQRKCAGCEEEERIRKKSLLDQITPVVQRRGSGNFGGAIATEGVTSRINQAEGSGRPMDKATRSSMESGFGADFSNIRVHTGSNAADLSKELNAQAFTVGNNIFFNEGKYNPNSHSGKHLLAHELTHTVQQGANNNSIQRFTCTQILNAEEGQRVSGIHAHQAITRDFRDQVGDRARGFRIPGATSLPIRLPCGDTPSDYIPPMVFVDQLRTRANVGIPDLGYIDNNRDVHLAEIKIGLHDCRDQADNQVARYVDQANMDDQEMVDYKNSRYMRRSLEGIGLTAGGLGDFHLMDPDSVGYNVPESILVDNTEVHLGECGNGVIVYKSLGEQSDDRHFCDQNADQFIDGLMDRAEEMVDDYLDRHVNRLVTQAINGLSLEDMITLAYQNARPAIRDLVVSNSSEAVWFGIESLGDERAVAALGAYIQNELGAQATAMLRPIIRQAKSVVIEIIRARMKEALRGFVETIIQELCSTTATVSIALALAVILRSIGRLFQNVLNEIIQEATIAAAAAIAITALIMMILVVIAIIVIIVIIVLALPEILAALGIGGTAAAGTATIGTTAAGTTALGTTAVGTTGVTATGVTLTLIQGGTATTVTATSTTTTAQAISIAAAALLAFFTSGGDDAEPSGT